MSRLFNGLLSMPDELLLGLVPYLYLLDLEALSITCKPLHRIFHKSLSNEQTFARNSLKDLTLDSYKFGYHDLLLRILRHEVNPKYIKRFDCRNSFGSDRYDCRKEMDVARHMGWTTEDISVIRESILRSPWLENVTMPDKLIDRILHRDEDAVLALLVPLMKNLSFFLPPMVAPLLRQVFVTIARAQIESEFANPCAWRRLPLRRVHTIFTSRNIRGHPIADAIHYMSLPSVRRIFLDSPEPEPLRNLVNADICSPARIPRSRASVVYMRDGEVWRKMADRFADYFIGPCIMRQCLTEPMPDRTEEEASVALQMAESGATTPPDVMRPYWDHCTIAPGQTEDPFMAINCASQAHEAWGGPKYQFTRKYRAFHDLATYRDNLEQYEAKMKQAGVVPSPEWLALIRWDRGLIHPEDLDDDNFTLEA